jgi:hypothetical protein
MHPELGECVPFSKMIQQGLHDCIVLGGEKPFKYGNRTLMIENASASITRKQLNDKPVKYLRSRVLLTVSSRRCCSQTHELHHSRRQGPGEIYGEVKVDRSLVAISSRYELHVPIIKRCNQLSTPRKHIE